MNDVQLQTLALIVCSCIWVLVSMASTIFILRCLEPIRYIHAMLREVEPAMLAWRLEFYFRKRRNQQGVMLMQSVAKLLQEPSPKRRGKATVDNPIDTPNN